MALEDDNFAVAWHSQDAERPEANRQFKKLKPSVPNKKDAEILEANSRCVAMDSHKDILKKDAEILEANSRCIAMDSHQDILKKDADIVETNSRCIDMDSHQDILKKDAETPESNTRHFFDWMKEFKELNHSKKAMNSQPDVLDEDAIYNLKKQFVEAKLSDKDMKPHPDIVKKVAERLAENYHPDIFKKGAAGVEARSRCIDNWKKKLEKAKKATNSHPDILKMADILQKMVENMEASFEFLDFMQKHSEKVPISTERKEGAKEIVESFQSFSSGGYEMWDEATKVFSSLITAQIGPGFRAGACNYGIFSYPTRPA